MIGIQACLVWSGRVAFVALVTAFLTIWPSGVGAQLQPQPSPGIAPGTAGSYGNAYPLLDPGTPGDLSLVALAVPDGITSRIAFVVRNDTETALMPVVSAVAYGPDGREVGRGEARNPPTFPFLVTPGEVAVGEIAFEQPVPIDAELEVMVAGVPVGNPQIGWLHLDAFDPQTGEGVLANQAVAGMRLENFWRRMACFTDGELTGLALVDIDATALGFREATTFRLMQVPSGGCQQFIFVGYGTLVPET